MGRANYSSQGPPTTHPALRLSYSHDSRPTCWPCQAASEAVLGLLGSHGRFAAHFQAVLVHPLCQLMHAEYVTPAPVPAPCGALLVLRGCSFRRGRGVGGGRGLLDAQTGILSTSLASSKGMARGKPLQCPGGFWAAASLQSWYSTAPPRFAFLGGCYAGHLAVRLPFFLRRDPHLPLPRGLVLPKAR